MHRRILVGGLALFAIAAAILFVPWATEKRVVVASNPVPPALFGITPAPVKPGHTACMQQVTFDPLSQVGQLGVATGSKPGPPLAITATAPGYRATAQIPAGYTDTQALAFNITPPRKPVMGQLCIRNAGKRAMSLNATTEFRTMGRPALFIDGVLAPYDAQLAFFSTQPKSYADRAGAMFRHAAIFTPGFLPPWLIGVLALVGLLGIPLGTVAALAVAVREDEPR